MIVVLLTCLTLSGARRADAARPADTTPTPAAPDVVVEFDRFSARRARTAEGEELTVSLLLRTAPDASLPCFVFVVARNDEVTPKAWAIWPPQSAGRAITAGGHFHGAEPSSGHAVALTDSWQRLTATISETTANARFDTVVVYVLTPEGTVLLSRPFRL